MCSGSKMKTSRASLIMKGMYGKQGGTHHRISALLEFSASDDVMGFKDAVEKEGHDIGEVALWYGRRVGSKEVGYEERTPLMIAAIFGSIGVLSYILGTGRADVNQACGSDGATALHCAIAGGSAASPEIIKLLLNASADVNVVDANGNRLFDLIVSMSSNIFNSRKKVLQAILEGADDVHEACLIFEEAICPKERRQQQQQQDMDAPRASKDSNEKKDFPIDDSVPNIKNGIYSTDEFRMYTFKVKPCSRAYSHDWTECPFVHPGENARRRDPRKYHYSCVPCPEFRKGSCSKRDACEYAHGIFECWLHPAQYRTRLCKDEIACTRRVCFFAHTLEELRPLYASTGSAMPSPTSYSPGASSLDIGSVSPFSLGSSSTLIPSLSTPPLTPSGESSPVGGTIWQVQPHVSVPNLQLSKSRLNSTVNARDIDLDIKLIGLENCRLLQKLLMDEMVAISPPSNWRNSLPNSPSLPTSLGDHAGELNKVVGMKPTNLKDIFVSQVQSPSGIWGYSSNLSTLSMIESPSYRIDPSGTMATMAFNSRNNAPSKQSQNFIERDVLYSSLELPFPSTSMDPSTLCGWSSLDGKLDWSIHGEELNKMRKSAFFGFQNRSSSSVTMATTPELPDDVIDEPDVSWVHSLVKEATPMESY